MVQLLVSTTEGIPGYRVKAYKGLVWASSARSKNIFTDVAAVVRSMGGGEIRAYKRMTNEARDAALRELLENAAKYGANAVVGLRFGSTQLLPSTVDVFAYGTAVMAEKEQK